ncbi:MAG: YggS family pyridoxal phosphate-dependent enzyme [Acidimicrobiales bacterium]
MSDPELSERVAAATEVLRSRIADAGGDPDAVRIIAVTKGHLASSVAAAAAAGLLDVGESYVQELVGKVRALEARSALDGAPEPPPVRWHLIGRLQRNKVRQAAPYVHLWQSIDRLSLAAEVAQRAPGAAVLVQVNVAGEGQQGGCPPERVPSVVEGCVDLGLDVRGLMAIGPQGPPAVVRAGFRIVRDLADRLSRVERSMGMSGDLEAAVAEGATMLRIGTALFGPRNRTTAVGN